MTHRAETILAAVETLVTGLTSTGTNVARGRVYPIGVDRALSVSRGTDIPMGDMAYTNISFMDRELEVFVIIHAKGVATNIETMLNQSAAEVYAALSADQTLGLGFVISAYPAGEDAPDSSADSDQPSGMMVSRWTVHYRHSVTSTEA